MRINIIFPFPDKFAFVRQLSKEIKRSHEIEVNNFDSSIVWDIIIVYEKVLENFSLNCKNGGLVFLSGEPPLMNYYTRRFLRQFDVVITSHKSISHVNTVLSQQSLPWLIGESDGNKYTFDYFENFLPSKNKSISSICSFKRILPGHNKRNKLIRDVIKQYPQIDLYGRSYNFIEDKIEALSDYRFHLCVENSIVPDYWTEKLSDPILALSVPIYIGCPNISSYFTENEVIDCTSMSFDELKKCIDCILENPEKEYQKRLPHLLSARNKVLNDYNLIPNVISKVSLSGVSRLRTVIAYQNTRRYKFRLLQIKALRRAAIFFGL